MKTETYACLGCGAECTRPLVRGQKPKWCSQRCADRGKLKERFCARCNKPYVGSGKRYCSTACANRATAVKLRRSQPKQLAIPIDQRSDIRRGYEDGIARLFFDAVRRDCKVNESGCWIWQRQSRQGYPNVRFGKRDHQLHRLVLEVKHGAPLGSQAGHHICANTMCVNPDHLQPITHRDNVAEMLARQSYVARIDELEAALAAVAPGHPVLRAIPVGRSA